MQLPSDYPRPVPTRFVEAEQTSGLSESAARAVLALSLHSLASPFSLLLAAYGVLLHRHSAEDAIAVGSSSLQKTPLVLEFAVHSDLSFNTVVANVLRAELSAVETNSTPFNVRFFNHTDTPDSSETTAAYNCDLTIIISQTTSLRQLLPIQIKMLYNSILFSESRIRDLHAQLSLILEAAARNPDAPIGEISLATPLAKKILPDPTADLHWNQFQGAITDIFHANALKFPDRVCVVENIANAGERVFNYKQMDDASNVVANHLIGQGVEREDVVVLYSYRGVDLVVAIMGVLKAGATFSVIDPAYPPARQIVYLSVAQPRALVILKKAGELHESVRNYISTELQIKCEIPALEIMDDGKLHGGVCDNVDILANDVADFPGVVLGPDSIGTLSFTSGSTGTPKGVQGRHFSLTHFYPWMKQEFGLSENERFTMLSGIAHDPIQRDIFTPLFLGAQLRIPTPEDIGTPGQLAVWMFTNEITITHLTPAMGQLLSATATQHIPTLRNAFFVGDVLTKRDVLRLQTLAKNCNVINMYGTTETQRAVSYYRIPSVTSEPGFLSMQKDIMPAGRGMQNVQLLVVNKYNKICGVGELGELFVRSGGLAEGYLKLEQATAEKFILNPFVEHGEEEKGVYYKGKRDRMYRTGDLGRYRPDGMVECSGRADDQVKIRGFRIELGEIDTHLSQHPGVRENVTLVRRNKDEEQTLVSYFVAQGEWEVEELIKDVREYLKTKVPSYAVPSVFVPLTRMPLTPNGKVDKNALPFPDTITTSKKPTDENFTTTEKSVMEIWTKLLGGNAQIGLDDNFFDVGGHSILATRLVFEIRKEMSVQVELGVVYKCPTVKSMAAEIDIVDASATPVVGEEKTENYADDVDVLDDPKISKDGLPEFKFPRIPKKFFVTGVTGFLGAFIVAELFARFEGCTVKCHVRAKSEEEGLQRVRSNGKKHLVWSEEWVESNRIQIVVGDLSKEKLGVSESVWKELCEDVDVIIHNGAMVHWVYPYHKLRAPNVISTVDCLRLSTTHHLKPMHFVSSTSALDTPYYIQLAETGKVSESDELEGSRHGLNGGYGQSKWVAEKLILRARQRGVPATIIRPGYILGDTKYGVTNGDDFLWRLIKGCIQLGKVPRMANIINMCPVDYVAGCVAAVASREEAISRGVFHIWNGHRFRFKDFFSFLPQHGYKVMRTDYIQWRTALMDLTLTTNDNALYPLLHFVLDDLPTSTKAPELDDSNTREILKLSNAKFLECPSMYNNKDDDDDFISKCMGYLVAVGFLPKPEVGVGQPAPNPSSVEVQVGVVKGLPEMKEWEGLGGQVLGRRNA